MRSVSRGLGRIDAIFDDPNLVANAGLLLVATLVSRLGLEALINDRVRLAGRVGGAQPGRKVLTMVHTLVAGGSHIDHADILRAGATEAVLVGGPPCVVQWLCGLGLVDRLLGGPGVGELGGGEVAVGGVGPVLVVVDAPVPDEDLGFEEAVELPEVEQFVA